MTEPSSRLSEAVSHRRTFAIISHPDAGKTTLTEKLLLYGGAIHLAGAVKQKGASRHATSDWMALEKERGISVSTSVMQFEFGGHHVNLLDTPGHNDFSEDTYRTLAAADSAVMLIDSVKGVEPQTIKLFQVCRMRGIPIVTFINKMDRLGQEPLDLMDEIERVLGIPAVPVSWPIGAGPEFQGVFERWSKKLLRFQRAEGGSRKAQVQANDTTDPVLREALGAHAHDKLLEDMDLLDVAGNEFDKDAFLRGELTPVFFGSALTNFGVEPFLHRFIELAPPPRARATSEGGEVNPDDPGFSGFVFKIQANMNPQHRDRIAFLRVVSGRFRRGMTATHVRTGKDINLSKSVQFLAAERVSLDEAYAGDIVGLWDPGVLRIGDSLTDGSTIEFEGIPRFSPEHFVRVHLADPLRRKQLKSGLDQLSEEGAVQIFYDRGRLTRDPVLGAVGVLQFDVLKYRLKAEYNVNIQLERLPYTVARWLEGTEEALKAFERKVRAPILHDVEERALALFESEWAMRYAERESPELQFVAAVQPGRSGRRA